MKADSKNWRFSRCLCGVRLRYIDKRIPDTKRTATPNARLVLTRFEEYFRSLTICGFSTRPDNLSIF